MVLSHTISTRQVLFSPLQYSTPAGDVTSSLDNQDVPLVVNPPADEDSAAAIGMLILFIGTGGCLLAILLGFCRCAILLGIGRDRQRTDAKNVRLSSRARARVVCCVRRRVCLVSFFFFGGMFLCGLCKVRRGWLSAGGA